MGRARQQAAATRARRRERKNIPRGRAFVTSTFNNTIVTITDPNGNVVAWGSGGVVGFKGSRKSTAYAAQLVAQDAARQGMAEYERDIDHAGFVAEWADPDASRAALERGAAIYGRVCANCHGTLDAPGSLPTAPRFATHVFKAGADPLSLYRTLTVGSGQMVPQGWMVPSQKYDVIHYIRETFLKDRNAKWYAAVTPELLERIVVEHLRDGREVTEAVFHRLGSGITPAP